MINTPHSSLRLFMLSGLLFLVGQCVLGQELKNTISGGAGAGILIGQTELIDKEIAPQVRVYGRYAIYDFLEAEAGLGFGIVKGKEYQSSVLPMDVRILLRQPLIDRTSVYAYGGLGTVHFSIQTRPSGASRNAESDGWATLFPVGAGFTAGVTENLSIDLNGGYNYTSTADINGTRKTDIRDAYWGILASVLYTFSRENPDRDVDGLLNSQERELGTDPDKADTDGDGISDGTEVTVLKTDPRKADSDNDGIPDNEERLTTKTNPLKADSDGDGLNDGEELTTHKTDPLKADTDGDGLSDKDELVRSKTDPFKTDTDGDGLKDGEELKSHKTDPLKADTDGGTVDDGAEVSRKSNPLDASDDVLKNELATLAPGGSIVLEGVSFAPKSDQLTRSSMTILNKMAEILREHPEIEVEIQGHTDNRGKPLENKKLSEMRAQSVKDYLVGQGIAAERMLVKGFGSEHPADTNTTPEGRAKNRRIEFFKLK
jgi:outer membrane protein OmpA-like peptidoglycan-associated protein